VLELENPESDAYRTILAECRRALSEDDCGAIVLGCAGMADLCHRLSDELGVPVIDGVTAATVTAEGLVRAGWPRASSATMPARCRKPIRGWSPRSRRSSGSTGRCTDTRPRRAAEAPTAWGDTSTSQRSNGVQLREARVRLLCPDQRRLASLYRCWNRFHPAAQSGQGELTVIAAMINASRWNATSAAQASKSPGVPMRHAARLPCAAAAGTPRRTHRCPTPLPDRSCSLVRPKRRSRCRYHRMANCKASASKSGHRVSVKYSSV